MYINRNFLLKSIFYDLDDMILYFSSETKIEKKLSELKDMLEYNDELIDKVSSKLENIILEKNGFKFIDNDNKELLKSIFTTFKKHNEEEKIIKDKDINYYPLTILENEKIIYPNKTYNDKLKDGFISEYKDKIVDLINRILVVINKNEDNKLIELKNINYILNILSNIFSYIPYFYQNKDCIGDISFYDKLKINTALSSCLYLLKERNELEETSLNDDFSNYFVLLSGDISGIQKFIYTISSKGALKSLRARSFYLEIMLEHIADEILEYFKLTRANLLYTGGGHFYIILPNFKDINKEINRIMQKLNDWFIYNFSIDLYIAMGIQEFNFNDLGSYLKKEENIIKDFSDVFRNLSVKLTEIKQRRYCYKDNKEQLIKLLDTEYNNTEYNKYRECTICHSDLKPTKEIIIKDKNIGHRCDICHNLYNAGKYILTEKLNIKVINVNDEEKLKKNVIKHKVVGLPSLSYNNVYLYFDSIKDSDNSINNNEEAVDNTIFSVIRSYSKNNNDNSALNIYLGDYNFRDNTLLDDSIKQEDYDKLTDFETLVKGTENNPTVGINRLAVLRCDVDSLGDAFMNGFRGHADILRTSSFSRHLSLFFKYYINFVCRGDVSFDNDKLFVDKYFNKDKYFNNKEKRIVIVYSGGDDVFLVGYWLDVINFTSDLRKAFRRYTNDRLTFSAGIGFFHTKYPISKMASQTGELEDLAKKNEYYSNNSIEKKKPITKDSVALFGIPYNKKEEFEYVFNWEEFENVRKKIEFLFENCYFSKDGIDKKIDDVGNEKVFLSSSMIYRLKQLIELSTKDKSMNIARLAYSLARISHNSNDNKCYNKFKDNIYNWFTSEDKRDIKYLNTALDLIIYLFRKE